MMQNESAETSDVIVIGGGPAGLVLATLLARRGYATMVFERSQYDRPRAGETLGGELLPLIENAGFADDLHELPRIPFRGVRSSWGSSAPSERSAIFNPYGEGWHVDRAAFDAALARAAVKSGVTLLTGNGATVTGRVQQGWSLTTGTGAKVIGRFLVDASGRGGHASNICMPERRWAQTDRMVALLALMTPSAPIEEPILEIETVPEGWWYSAPQPDGGLLVALMTDSDLLPAGSRQQLTQTFHNALTRTSNTAQRCRSAGLRGEPWVARADTGMLLPHWGDNWCAVGDAAMGCDPLGGDGVARALRSAFAAAPLIEQALNGSEVAVANASVELRQIFIDYIELRSRYYLYEQRYSDCIFWMRRHPIDWRAAPIFLDPQQQLHRDGTIPARELIAPVEALIPPRLLKLLLRQVRHPIPAHEALNYLCANTPFESRRMLVGLQDLIARGIVLVK